jgi:tetratricopeptide (TPR) repeat protein
MAPIGKDPQPPLAPEQNKRYAELIDEATGADDPAAALERLTAALALYDRGARPHYLLGQTYARLGDDREALDAFIRARDLDTMPWRAASAANKAAKSMATRGAIVCDMEASMRNASPHGAIGWELMSDHVHMTLRGQSLFAATIVREMTRLPDPLRVDEQKLAALPEWSEYANRLGANVYNEYVAASRMRTLFEIPFLASSNSEGKDRFTRLCDELTAQMSERDREAVTQWHDPGLHVSNHRPLTFVVGYHRMIDGDYATAERLFDIARASLARASFWRLQLTWYMLKCRRGAGVTWDARDDQLVRDAVEVGTLLDRFVGFRTPLDPGYLGMVYNVAGDHPRAVALLDNAVRYAKGVEGWDMVRAMADSLVRTGAVDRARLLLTLAQKDEEMAPSARALLAELDIRTRTANDE